MPAFVTQYIVHISMDEPINTCFESVPTNVLGVRAQNNDTNMICRFFFVQTASSIVQNQYESTQEWELVRQSYHTAWEYYLG